MTTPTIRRPPPCASPTFGYSPSFPIELLSFEGVNVTLEIGAGLAAYSGWQGVDRAVIDVAADCPRRARMPAWRPAHPDSPRYCRRRRQHANARLAQGRRRGLPARTWRAMRWPREPRPAAPFSGAAVAIETCGRGRPRSREVTASRSARRSPNGNPVAGGRAKAVQPPEIGTVCAILVRDGQSVAAGEVLVELDDTEIAADAVGGSRDYFRRAAKAA